MKKTIVYKLIREDNQIYIGITVNFKARLSAHKKSKRFSELKIKEYEILYECDTYEEAEILEEEMIKKYNSFYNGLNESINGKGNHLSKKFNTLGFKFSEDSKQKMKDNHWSKSGIESYWTGKNHSEETKEKISKSKSGIYYHKRKYLSTTFLKFFSNFLNGVFSSKV